MLSRPVQNWNRVFAFDVELAEISGVQNRGIPLFLFPPVHPYRFHRCHAFIPRAFTRLPVPRNTGQKGGTRKTRRKRVTKIATVYHHQVDGYPDNAPLFIVTVLIHVRDYSFSFSYINDFPEPYMSIPSRFAN